MGAAEAPKKTCVPPSEVATGLVEYDAPASGPSMTP